MIQVGSRPVPLLPLRLWWWCGDRELLWLCLGFELVLLLEQVRWQKPRWRPYACAACQSLEYAYFWGGVAVALTLPQRIPAGVSPRVRARQQSLPRLEGPIAIACVLHSLLLLTPAPPPPLSEPELVPVEIVDWTEAPPSVSESAAVPEPAAEAIPEPVAEPVPEPVAEAIPEPVAEPVPEPAAEPVPEPVAEAIPEPVAEPVPEPAAKAVPEPVAEPVPEPVAEPVTEPAAEAIPEPVAEAVPEPVAESVPEPVAEAVPQFTPLIEGLRQESSPPLPVAAPATTAPVASETATSETAAPEAAPVAALPEPTLARPIPGQNPRPDYPAAARRLNQQGQVVLRALVTVQGQVTTVEVAQSSGFPALDEAARRTVSGWGFTPAQQGDQPIESWVMVPIVFSLQ